MVCVSLCNFAAALLRFLLFTPTDVTQQDCCGREEAPGPATGIWDGGAIVWYKSALHIFSCSVKIVLQVHDSVQLKSVTRRSINGVFEWLQLVFVLLHFILRLMDIKVKIFIINIWAWWRENMGYWWDHHWKLHLCAVKEMFTPGPCIMSFYLSTGTVCISLSKPSFIKHISCLINKYSISVHSGCLWYWAYLCVSILKDLFAVVMSCFGWITFHPNSIFIFFTAMEASPTLLTCLLSLKLFLTFVPIALRVHWPAGRPTISILVMWKTNICKLNWAG